MQTILNAFRSTFNSLNHLINANNRRIDKNFLFGSRRIYFAPHSASQQILDFIRQDDSIRSAIKRELQGQDTLYLAAAVVDNELRINAYDVTSDNEFLPIGGSDQKTSGITDILIARHDGSEDLIHAQLIQQAIPSLRHNPYDVLFSWAVHIDEMPNGVIHTRYFKTVEC